MALITQIPDANPTDVVPISLGGTNATTATDARANLGLIIGANVQAYDADLASIAALSPTTNNFIVGNGTAWTLQTPALARTILGGTTIGQNLFTLPDPSAVTFPRFNANNTVSALAPSDLRLAISAFGGVSTDLNTGSSNFAWVHTNTPDTTTDFNIVQGTGGTAYSRSGTFYGVSNGPFGNQWYSITNMQHRGGSTVSAADGQNFGTVLAFGLTANQTRVAFRTKANNVFQSWREIVTMPVSTGTANTIPRFSGNAALQNSSITDNGTLVNVTVPLVATSLARAGGTSGQFLKADGSVDTTIYQPYDADLATIAGFTPTTNNFIVGNGTSWTLQTPSQARASLGGTTVGQNLLTLTNPSAITFPRINADNTVSTLNATAFLAALGGVVTSVNLTVPTGLTVSGAPITSNGTIAISLASGYSIPTTTAQSTWDAKVTNVTAATPIFMTGNTTNPVVNLAGEYGDTKNPYGIKPANFFLAGSDGASPPVFRAILAADIPQLNQNTTGTAGNVTGIVAIANGGTGANTTAAARTNLGLEIGTNVQAYDADLATIAGFTPTADNFIVGNGTSWTLETPAQARSSLGLVIGTDVQAYDAHLAAIAALTPTADNFIVGNGTAWTLETPSQTRTSLGGTTIGQSLFTLTDPSAVTFPRFNANNTVSALSADDTRTAIGAGTVNSVGGTGTVSGLSLSGSVTTSGNLTLSGTLSVTPSNFASQTANTVLAAPNGTEGAPTFRALVAEDIPTLNQNTTGTAANVTGIVAVANGGTGANSTSAARTNLGAFGGVSTDLNTDASNFAWTHTNLPDAVGDFDSLQTTNAYSRVGSFYGATNGPFGDQWYSIVNMQHRGGSGDGNLWGSVLAIGLTNNQTRAAFRTKNSPNDVTTYSAWREIITAPTGTGTSSTIPKFTGAGAITDSSVTDDGTTVKATAGRLVFATGGTDRGTIRTAANEIAIESQGAIHFNYYGGGFGGAQSGRAPVFFWKGSNYGTATIPTLAFEIEGVAGQSRCYGNFLANIFQSVGEWNAANAAAQIYLNGLTGNRIEFNTLGQGFPTFTTRSVGTKIVLHPNVGASTVDYAIGFVADGSDYGIWNSVPANNANFYWRAGIANVATLTGEGSFSCANVIAGSTQFSRIYAGLPISGTIGTARVNINSFGNNFIDFHYLGSANPNGQIYYSTGTGTVVYATTSDYRLKTDVKAIENPTDKVMQLKPCNFRMLNSTEAVDGFLAHEVQEVVGYAAFGEKDAVREDGEIIPQTMDMSKLVPLLTAALQDALKRIEKLEKIIADKQGEEHGQ